MYKQRRTQWRKRLKVSNNCRQMAVQYGSNMVPFAADRSFVLVTLNAVQDGFDVKITSGATQQEEAKPLAQEVNGNRVRG
jgi:hypothetical protein